MVLRLAQGSINRISPEAQEEMERSTDWEALQSGFQYVGDLLAWFRDERGGT